MEHGKKRTGRPADSEKGHAGNKAMDHCCRGKRMKPG